MKIKTKKYGELTIEEIFEKDGGLNYLLWLKAQPCNDIKYAKWHKARNEEIDRVINQNSNEIPEAFEKKSAPVQKSQVFQGTPKLNNTDIKQLQPDLRSVQAKLLQMDEKLDNILKFLAPNEISDDFGDKF